MTYIVKRGDTLWNISKRITGNPLNYKKISDDNKLSDPNLIYVGQKLKIKRSTNIPKPEKKKEHNFKSTLLNTPNIGNREKPQQKLDTKYNIEWKQLRDLKFELEIPKKENSTKSSNVNPNKNTVQKKLDDKWDIKFEKKDNLLKLEFPKNKNSTSNTKTTKNIRSTELQDLYKLKFDDEKENLKLEFPKPKPSAPLKKQQPHSFGQLIPQMDRVNNFHSEDTPVINETEKYNTTQPYFNPFAESPLKYISNVMAEGLDSANKWLEQNETYQNIKNTIEQDGLAGLIPLIKNKLSRNNQLSEGDYFSSDVPLTIPTVKDSNYNIRPGTYFNTDTIKDENSVWNDRKYLLSGYINANEELFGGRNTRDYTPIYNTEGVALPLLQPLKPYGQHDTQYGENYIGYDKNGNLKAGTIDLFGEGDMLSNTTANDIYGFKHDNDGQVTLKIGRVNKDRFMPVTMVKNGKQAEGSVNILSGAIKGPKEEWRTQYGSASGGQLLVRAGNEVGIISGSILDLDRQIEEMKQRNNTDYVTVYNSDNGSFSTGLKTYDRNLLSHDLQTYDALNAYPSGSFLYRMGRKPDVYSSDTILTPNIRTKDSDSYKAGHSLVNEKKGVVLHHTAFTGDDLTSPLAHMTNPESEASAHVLIGYKGERKVMASPDKVTFHAGASMWNGRTNVNDFMLGIEFLGDTNKKDLTKDLILSAIEYLKPIVRKYNIPLELIVTHELIRTLYNDYARKNNLLQAPGKPDINLKNYKIILTELKKLLYYEKPEQKIKIPNVRSNVVTTTSQEEYEN